MEIENLVRRLEKGVQSRIERWPGNDGQDVVQDIAGSCATMQEAAIAITILSQSLDSIQKENDRYISALEKIMGDPMDSDTWFRREARRALAGGNNGR